MAFSGGVGGEWKRGNTERRLGVTWVGFARCLRMMVTVGRLSADVDQGHLQRPEETDLAPFSTQRALSDIEESRCGSGRGGRGAGRTLTPGIPPWQESRTRVGERTAS